MRGQGARVLQVLWLIVSKINKIVKKGFLKTQKYFFEKVTYL